MVSSRAIGYLLALSLSSTTMLAGCDMVLLRPSGYVAAQQGHLVVISTLLMLLIVVPVIALTLLKVMYAAFSVMTLVGWASVTSMLSSPVNVAVLRSGVSHSL